MPAQAQPFAFTPSGTGFYTLTRLYMCLYMCTLKSVYITYMFLCHRSMMIPAALVFMLLTVSTRSAPCSTLQSCVDNATAANSTLSTRFFPPVLRASTANCNVSIIGNSGFEPCCCFWFRILAHDCVDRHCVRSVSPSETFPPIHAVYSGAFFAFARFALSHCCKHLAPAT